MFHFVVWVVGLSILFSLATFNVCIVVYAFAIGRVAGLLASAASVFAWLLLLFAIFG